MKKIGIITIHSDLNYGAALQAYALTSFLSENFYAKIIDYRKIPNHPRVYPFPVNIAYSLMNLLRLFRYRMFLKPFISKVRYNNLDDLMNTFSEDFDVLISGSDQIWNPTCGGFNKLNPAYFLAFASKEKYKKISYASSLGSYIYNADEIKQVSKWLGEYSHLSTREDNGKKQLESILSTNVKIVLDPTLLLNKEQWNNVSSKVNLKVKYVLVYYIDEIEEVTLFAKKIAERINCKVVLMTNSFKKHHNVDINVSHCGPAEFLWLFEHAEFIVTNSFHGTAFSINFNKNFISVIKRNSPQRAQNLLSNVGLSDRLLVDIKEVDNLPLNIDYTLANNKLNILRSESIDYLLKSIEY